MVDRLQLIMLLHIDDLLLSHTGSHIIAYCIKKVDGTYGSKDPLEVTRAKKHECIGMTIDFSLKIWVVIS